MIGSPSFAQVLESVARRPMTGSQFSGRPLADSSLEESQGAIEYLLDTIKPGRRLDRKTATIRLN
jgi:hypothetical protein